MNVMIIIAVWGEGTKIYIWVWKKKHKQTMSTWHVTWMSIIYFILTMNSGGKLIYVAQSI